MACCFAVIDLDTLVIEPLGRQHDRTHFVPLRDDPMRLFLPLGSINLRVSGTKGTVVLQGLANLWREDNRLEPVSDPGSDLGDKGRDQGSEPGIRFLKVCK